MSKNKQDLARVTRQTQFALSIARGNTVAGAARESGTPQSTAYRWLGDPTVATMVSAYRRRIVSETIGQVTSMGRAAADRIRTLIDSDDESIALKAATTALAEIRRIADALGGDVLTTPIPIPPSKPETQDDYFEFLSEAWLADLPDPDDEPLPEQPDTSRMTKTSAVRAEKNWQDEWDRVYDRNKRRRVQKRRSAEQETFTAAEVAAATLKSG